MNTALPRLLVVALVTCVLLCPLATAWAATGPPDLGDWSSQLQLDPSAHPRPSTGNAVALSFFELDDPSAQPSNESGDTDAPTGPSPVERYERARGWTLAGLGTVFAGTLSVAYAYVAGAACGYAYILTLGESGECNEGLAWFVLGHTLVSIGSLVMSLSALSTTRHVDDLGGRPRRWPGTTGLVLSVVHTTMMLAAFTTQADGVLLASWVVLGGSLVASSVQAVVSRVAIRPYRFTQSGPTLTLHPTPIRTTGGWGIGLTGRF